MLLTLRRSLFKMTDTEPADTAYAKKVFAVEDNDRAWALGQCERLFVYHWNHATNLQRKTFTRGSLIMGSILGDDDRFPDKAKIGFLGYMIDFMGFEGVFCPVLSSKRKKEFQDNQEKILNILRKLKKAHE